MELPSPTASFLAVQAQLLNDLYQKHQNQAGELEFQRQQLQRQEQKLQDLEQKVYEQARKVREPARQGLVNIKHPSINAPPIEEAIADIQDAQVNLEAAANTSEPVAMRKLDTNPTNYTFEGSVWDSSILVGFPCVDAATVLTVLLGIGATITVDICFVLIVFANYNDNPFSDHWLRGLLHWRAVTAHAYELADSQSHVSFAASVCAEVSALTTSGKIKQAGDFRAFRNPDIDDLRDLNGWFLAIIALLVWYFSILEEVGGNYIFTRSIFARRGTSASMVAREGQIKIISFSFPQVMLVVLVVSLPRLIISLGLGYSGILFLAYTQNIGDLLLNAMALMFVLDMDETFYHGMLPLRVKNLMDMLEPLTCPRVVCSSSMWQFNDFFIGGLHNSLLRILLVVAGLLLANFTLLEPFNDRMDTAMHFLCGGRTDFVFTTNYVNNVVLFAKTPSFDEELAYESSYVKQSVLKLIDLDPRRLEAVGMELPSIIPNSEEVPLNGILGVYDGGRDFSASRLYCIDHTNASLVRHFYPKSDPLAFTESLRDNLHMPSLNDCSDVYVADCSNPANSVPRALCPRHCGCDNPWQGQFYAKGFSGCPASCDIPWELNAYYLPPEPIAAFTDFCLDVPPQVLREAPSWQNYRMGLLADLSSLFTPKASQLLVENVNEFGCAALWELRSTLDVCLPGSTYHSVRIWCPRTCQCSPSDLKECPRSCGSLLEYDVLPPPQKCSFGTEVSTQLECQFAADVKLGVNFTSVGDACSSTSCSCLFYILERTVKWTNADNDPQHSASVVCQAKTPLFYHSQTPVTHMQKEMALCHLQDRLWNSHQNICTSSLKYVPPELRASVFRGDSGDNDRN